MLKLVKELQLLHHIGEFVDLVVAENSGPELFYLMGWTAFLER